MITINLLRISNILEFYNFEDNVTNTNNYLYENKIEIENKYFLKRIEIGEIVTFYFNDNKFVKITIFTILII